MERRFDRGEAEGRATAYCLVPPDLAGRLLEPLRQHLDEAGGTSVIVERRSGERRSEAERRRADDPRAIPASGDRRTIHNPAGRRVADRRAPVVAATPPEGLPRRIRRQADRLTFIERLEPSAERLEDEDTARVVIGFQAGEHDAFTTLYRRYFDRVYAYLLLVVRDPHEAEDIAQESFLRVLGALPRYELRTQPFRAWLFTIVRNHALNELEKLGRVEVVEPARLREEAMCGVAEGETSALGWITDTDVLHLVRRLPASQRQVLMLRFMLDLDSATVGRILDRSPQDVRKLQSRALAVLRERLVALGRGPRGGRSPRMRRTRPQVTVLRARRWALSP